MGSGNPAVPVSSVLAAGCCTGGAGGVSPDAVTGWEAEVVDGCSMGVSGGADFWWLVVTIFRGGGGGTTPLSGPPVVRLPACGVSFRVTGVCCWCGAVLPPCPVPGVPEPGTGDCPSVVTGVAGVTGVVPASVGESVCGADGECASLPVAEGVST
ncbi:hypothetical protein GCM10017688_46470 [Streptomyces ramulosus]